MPFIPGRRFAEAKTDLLAGLAMTYLSHEVTGAGALRAAAYPATRSPTAPLRTELWLSTPPTRHGGPPDHRPLSDPAERIGEL